MGQRLTYQATGGTGEGYLAVPKAGPQAPAVLVVHEWWGLVPHITSVAERFADAGFTALAPDLYQGKATSEPAEARTLLADMSMNRAARDLSAAADHLAEVSGGRPAGVVGFYTGGSLALWAATLTERLVTAVGFYPMLPWEQMGPDWSAYAGKAAVIHRCDEDVDTVEEAKAAISAAGGAVTVYDYPDTKHGFFNDDRPAVYDRVSSARAWARTIEVLRHTLTA
jgi:carboxymethylenebutenolidase